MPLTIKPSSSPSKRTPPALLIASSSGRVRTSVIGNALIALAKASGAAKVA
ncbi:hypothetical protein D3C73_1560540 [compost metagenome]